MKSVFISCVKQKYMFVAISLLLVLLSCISLSAAEPRVVRVGAFNFHPGIFKDTDGVVKGFYVDALADIARRENIKFEYVYGSWSEGLERIKSGEVDVLTSVAFTEERAAFLDYTVTPLLTVWGELYTPLESEIDGIREVRGKKIAVMEGDYNARSFIDLVKKFDIPCEFVSMPGFEDVFRAVAAHKVDAGVVNNTFGAAKQKEYGLRSTGVVFNPFDIFFAVAKDKNQPLLALLESNLASWRHQVGSPFNEARKKWSHSGGIVNIIPRWLVTALVLVVLSMTVALVFVVVLKRQVRSKTKSIVESAEMLQKSQSLLESITQGTSDAIYLKDTQGRYLVFNAAASRFVGKPSAEVLGKDDMALFPPDEARQVMTNDRQVMAAGVTQTYEESVIAAGVARTFLATKGPVRDAQGEIIGLFGIARDITERKRAEEVRIKSEAELARAQEIAHLGNWSWDIVLDRVSWSDEMLRIYGVDPSNFGATVADVAKLIHPEDLWKQERSISDLLSGCPFHPFDYRVVRPDGSMRVVEVKSVKLDTDSEGRPLKMFGIAQDITERKQAEAALRQSRQAALNLMTDAIAARDRSEQMSQALRTSEEEIRELNRTLEHRVQERTAELLGANQELESFAYAVSHDLRQPLRAMNGFSRALLEDHGATLPGAAHEHLDEIILASQRMGELIDGLLRLSRSTRGELLRDAVDLSALASRILGELAATEPERRVTWTVEPGLTARGDERMIEVVLANLLGNAWKYTVHRADVKIEVGGQGSGRSGNPPEPRTLNPEVGFAVFFVRDNGAGFDMKHAAKLFQPFQRLHREDEFPGIGIGLATVQRIVRRHGGTIQASAAPEQGATFCFSLPVLNVNDEEKR